MGSLVHSKSLVDCLCRVSFKRYSPLSLEVVENPINVKVLAPIFGMGEPDFSATVVLLARFTVNRLAKFGGVPFAELRLRSLAMK